MTVKKIPRRRNAARTLDHAMEKVRERFREWGRRGAKRRLRVLSPQKRREIARKAALARWRKKRAT
jgi:hypothetical protein